MAQQPDRWSITTQPCKYCDKRIIWARGSRGGNVPVSADSKEKRILLEILGPDDVRAHVRDTYLPHHADCAGVEQARADKAAKETISKAAKEKA